jgi:hypothetical protein
LWLAFTAAGRSVLEALGLVNAPVGIPAALYNDWQHAVELIPRWLTEVLKTPDDERLLGVLAWLACFSVLLALGRRHLRDPRVDRPKAVVVWRALLQSRLLLLVPLPLLASLAYFWLPEAHDWMWPINGRMPLLVVLLAIPLLPTPGGRLGKVLAALVLLVALRGAWLVNNAFGTHERSLEGFEACVARVPLGAKVAGLIFDAGSPSVRFAPLLHAAAWVQAQRGGVAMFTFADFPQSPFRFREENRPPRVAPRWEWLPQRVEPDQDLLWYDFVLVRHGPGVIKRSEYFHLVERVGDWSLWRRGPRAEPRPSEGATQ